MYAYEVDDLNYGNDEYYNQDYNEDYNQEYQEEPPREEEEEEEETEKKVHINIQTFPKSEINDIVQDLLDNNRQVSSVDLIYHKDILARLCVLKNESLHGKNFERARNIQSLINQLSLSDVDAVEKSSQNVFNVTLNRASQKVTKSEVSFRTRSVFSQTVGGKIPSISTYQYPSQENEPLMYQSELESSEFFWTTEIKRFKEMRETSYKKLIERQKAELNHLVNSDLGISMKQTQVSRDLRERTQKLKTKNPNEAEDYLKRASRIEIMEYQHQLKRANQNLQAKIDNLKIQHSEERVEFNRKWDNDWKRMQTQMMSDIEEKQRPLLKTRARSVITSQNERQMMRKSCPASILSTIMKNK